MEGIDLKIRSFWHAGTYDKRDLTFARGVRGKHFEYGWFDITDRIFVGSDYHKHLLNETRDVPLDKITVTGCPLDLKAFEDGSKTPKVRKFLFTGRKSPEKGYDVVQSLQREGVPIAVSLDEGWNKHEFYHQLAQTEIVVNPALQETFGIGMMEAMASNVPVIVPDIPQFQTTVPPMYRVPYSDFLSKDKFLVDVERILSGAGYERALVEKYDYSKVMETWLK
jgi:glycosyltransferase involved in cell wall biosynthesis